MTHTVDFNGPILYLCDDPQLVAAQLKGQALTREAAGPLRNDVSTDEITPVTVMLTYDEELGRFPYTGFQTHGAAPIGVDAIRNGGFRVTVAGKRYGKGSSRESSPLAEYYAGIRLIIAESFERIYQQNCDNIGILTSTNFSLIARIEAGESIPVETFLEGRDALTCQIIRAGGLLNYSKTMRWPARLCDSEPLPDVGTQPRTLVEKIVARHLHPDTPDASSGNGVFIATDWRFSHDYFTGMSAHFMHRAFGDPAVLHEPDRIVAFEDHLILAPQSLPHRRDGLLDGVAHLVQGHRSFAANYPVRSHGPLSDGFGAEGICHALMTERYALPGQVIAGTDSHTPHAGALGCLALGVGATDIANSWVSGYIRLKMQDTVRIQVDGQLRPGVMAKDVVLNLLRREDIRSGAAIGAVFEFCGEAVSAMSVDERATLTNMVAELGGCTGIVAPDEKTVAFLRERRGIEFALQPWMRSDASARYRMTIQIDGGSLSEMVARPGDPGNGVALAELESPVPIDIAYGGSCTAGKREDFDGYHAVLQWGLEHGLTVADGTRLYLQFGTIDVLQYCTQRGYLETFERAGAQLILPGCGACANCGPGQSGEASDVTISAINRNFPGRSGPGSVWLASPVTVAASALLGRIVSFAGLRMERGVFRPTP